MRAAAVPAWGTKARRNATMQGRTEHAATCCARSEEGKGSRRSRWVAGGGSWLGGREQCSAHLQRRSEGWDVVERHGGAQLAQQRLHAVPARSRGRQGGKSIPFVCRKSGSIARHCWSLVWPESGLSPACSALHTERWAVDYAHACAAATHWPLRPAQLYQLSCSIPTNPRGRPQHTDTAGGWGQSVSKGKSPASPTQPRGLSTQPGSQLTCRRG